MRNITSIYIYTIQTTYGHFHDNSCTTTTTTTTTSTSFSTIFLFFLPHQLVLLVIFSQHFLHSRHRCSSSLLPFKRVGESFFKASSSFSKNGRKDFTLPKKSLWRLCVFFSFLTCASTSYSTLFFPSRLYFYFQNNLLCFLLGRPTTMSVCGSSVARQTPIGNQLAIFGLIWMRPRFLRTRLSIHAFCIVVCTYTRRNTCCCRCRLFFLFSLPTTKKGRAR